jgi:two-component system, NarL family, invasion response regulator UvrY
MSLFVSSPGLAVPATRRTGVADPGGGLGTTPTVAIYHDQALARAALGALLRHSDFEVLAAAPIDVEDVLTGPGGEAPDVALVSVAGQGIAIAHRLGRERRSRVLLKLEGPPDRNRLLAVAATGASGAICRQCPPERMLRAIRAVAAGGMSFECMSQQAEHPAPTPALALSERERRVALELARGAGSEEIAAALCISPHTARTHVRNIKRKLGARTLAQAVALSITMGLVTPPAAGPGA